MTKYGFKDPWILLLLLLIPLFIIIAKKSYANISRSKKVFITFLRIIAFTLLVFCLAGLSKTMKNDELFVIYLVDISHSNSSANIYSSLNYIKRASDNMSKNDKAAVIVFGRDAVVELPFSNKIGFFKITSYLNKAHTDISQAIKIAELLFPEDAQTRIVLFTDGNENEGNAVEEAKIAASHGIEFLTVIPKSENAADFKVEKLIVPKNVNINEPFEVRVVLSGNYDGVGTLRVLMDKGEIFKEDVKITPNKKKVVTFEQTIKKKGAHIFNIELSNKGDMHVENNVSQGFVFVAGEPSALYVYSGENKSDDLIKVIEGGNIKVDTITPELLYPSISFLRNYDTIILDNVSATSLSTHQMKSIQSYIKSVGGGLIMLGGENSYGMGGYYRTPIEKALPVEMDIKQRKQYARVAMVVIIDKSGSMSYMDKGKQKIELANEGAVNVVESLFKTDLIGVMATDSVPKWVVPITEADLKGSIIDDIRTIRAGGGGIYCYSSLYEAREKLKDLKVNLKHIIMFADSADAEEKIGVTGEHTYDLVKRMRKERITTTTIAIGREGDRDIEYLKETAAFGGGRYYFTNDMFTLPQIFAKEAFIASKSLIVDVGFTPKKNDFAPALEDVDLTTMPKLEGYVITTPKKLAVVPYLTDDDDPLLAMWQYGLGRTAAFTSDAKDRWAKNWIGTDEYAKFWLQLVRWSLKSRESTNYEVNLEKKANKLSISVDALDDDGGFLNFADLKATLVYPNFDSKIVDLKQTGAGRYEASENLDKSGTYFVNISRYKNSEVTDSVNAGLSLPYLDEYKKYEINVNFLNHLMDVSNGKIIQDIADIFEHNKEPLVTYRTIVTPLIMLAIVFFVLDAMVRKITFASEKAAVVRQSYSDRPQPGTGRGAQEKRNTPAARRRVSGDAGQGVAAVPEDDAMPDSAELQGDEVAPPETTLSKLLKVKKDTFKE